MTKFVKCIDNRFCKYELTMGKKYKVHEIYKEYNDVRILITNDCGKKEFYFNSRFSFDIKEEVDDSILNRKLNAIKDVVLFLANKQATKDVEEYELLKNLIDTLENEF